MKLKNIKLKNLLLVLFIACAYPAVRALTAESGDRLLFFINAITIVGLVFVIVGVVYMAVLKGDFDITSYVAKRVFDKNVKPFKAYRQDKQEEREDSFNYPLFTAILLLATAAILSAIFY